MGENENDEKSQENLNKSTLSMLNNMYDDFYGLFTTASKDSLNSLRNTTERVDFNKLAELYRKEQEESTKTSVKTSVNEEPKEIKREEEKKEIYTTNDVNTKLDAIFKRIDDSHLTEDSKIVVKKMIEYAKKYNENIVKNYIPFNMRIYCDNDDILYSIVNILIDGFSLFNYIKCTTSAEKSFFVIDETSHISDLYDREYGVIILSDCNGLLQREELDKAKILSVWERNIIKRSNSNDKILTIIHDKEKIKIDELFAKNITLRDKIFDFELFTSAPSPQEVYQEIVDRFSNESFIMAADFELKLLDYVTETYPRTTVSSKEYIDATIEKILFNQTGETLTEKDIPEYETNKSIEEIFKDLNELVGLQNVKDMLNDLVSLCEFKKMAGSELKLKDTNLHMVFLGNPGTGKTTVARMVAGILYNLGYIRQNKLIEVTAKDLIGQYVGQTAPKTMSVIEKALGGVLFIDEAYALASKPGNNSSFNEECIATLIQAMENYRDNLVVIFAGYSKEMDAFLKSNSGIISRIGYQMEFKDYTNEELLEIFSGMFKKAGFVVTPEALSKASTIIDKYRHTEGFGNARFARTLYEKTIIAHATNLKNEKDPTALKTITEKDISDENVAKL